MKKIILLLSIAAITFLGCEDAIENTIPSAPTETHQITKTSPSSNYIYTLLYASKLVDGSIGCDFIYDTTFINYSGREINVYARLKIEPGSFSGIIEIIMIPNIESLSIQLFPELTFNQEVKLTLVYSGIDVKSFGFNRTGEVDFAFFQQNGGFELIESDLSHVNLAQDEIKVMNAKLNHFSRYGWVR